MAEVPVVREYNLDYEMDKADYFITHPCQYLVLY